jgi:predicted Fe-Mo cluster-binding NifX family protein
VASDDPESTSLVSNFAAFSQYYLLFSALNMVQVLRNPFLDKGPGAGPLVVEYLAEKGVGTLIAGRFGPPMIDAMDRKGMRYFQYSGVAQDAVERAVNYLKPAEKGGGGKPGD